MKNGERIFVGVSVFALVCSLNVFSLFGQGAVAAEELGHELQKEPGTEPVETGAPDYVSVITLYEETAEPVETGAPDYVPEITPYEEPAEPVETGAPVYKLFKDYTYEEPVKQDSITLYANGGTVKKDGVTKNYKSSTMYTKIQPSYIYTTDKNGKLKTASGKVVVGITGSNAKKPELVKGKIVDAEAAKVAKASFTNGQIKVTAQSKAGNVYLWVMDTGDLSKSANPDEANGTFCCCPVTVKMAPVELQTYDREKEEVVPGNTPKYTKKTLDLFETTDVYVCPLYKDGKEKKKTSDGTYHVEVEKGAVNYFEAVKTGPEKFTVRATGLKDNKTTKGKIIIKNDQNQKKVIFNVTAVNHVKKVTIEKPSGVTMDESTGAIKISTSAKAKVSGTVTANLKKAGSAFETTDAPKIYAMKTAAGYDSAELKNGKVKITSKPTSTQKKITASIAKDKKTITISAAKGVKAGETAYFLLVYNTLEANDDGNQRGYEILTVNTQ